MPQDHFALLGLSPGRHSPHVVDQHFAAARTSALRDLDSPARYLDARRRLEELYVAHRVLRDPGRQAAYLQDLDHADAATELRRLIAASIEDGLLRQSRRAYLVERGTALGFSEFQVHLLIAQALVDDPAPLVTRPTTVLERPARRIAWRELAAVGALATAMFMLLIRWVGI